tara:strand:- start:162 stop:272 length:111 start_codon:yes stop_codon:yes gene_type:complete
MKFNASPKLSNGNIVASNGNSIKKKKKKIVWVVKDK